MTESHDTQITRRRRAPVAIVAVAVGVLALVLMMVLIPSAFRSDSGTASMSQDRGPSAPAQMICAVEPQRGIAEALGVVPNESLAPTWVDDVYSCRYAYDGGDMVLSVHDMSSSSAALKEFDALQVSLPSTSTLDGLGQAAFSTPDGSLFIIKDFDVLIVDVSGLPEDFGPALGRDEVARLVANVILKCWVEHF